MSSIGFGLIKSLVDKDLPITEMYEQGIDENYFLHKEKAAFDFIKNYKQNYNEYPSLNTVAAEINDPFAFEDLPLEALGYWAHQVLERKQHAILSKAVHDVQDLTDKQQIKSAIVAYKEYFDKLNATDLSLKARDIQTIQQEVIEIHNQRQIDPDLPGISYGFKALDEITGGHQGGDFNLIIGETGSCKSYFSLKNSFSAWDEGANVLMISPEMPEWQLARRMLGLQCKYPDRALKRGEMSYYAIQKAKETIELSNRNNFLKILPSGLTTDINQIVTIANEYRPDFLIVDGIYLLTNNRHKGQRWEIDESIYFILKNFGLHKNIPILAVTQYNRTNQNKLQGARGTQSAEQVASTFLSIEYESEEDKETKSPEQTRLIKVKKSRDGDRITLRININFDNSTFTEDAVLSGPEYLDEQEETDDISNHNHIENI